MAGIESAAIVFHGNFEGLLGRAKPDQNLGSAGVFDRIMQRFLEGEKHVVPHFGTQVPVGKLEWQIQPATDSRAGEPIVPEFFEIGCQALQGVVPRIHRPDDFIHAPRQLAGGIVNFLQSLRSRFGIRYFGPRRITDHGDAGELRAEVVMDVSRDAGAFAFDVALAFHSFEPSAHSPAGIKPNRGAGGEDDDDTPEYMEPVRLPKVGEHLEGESGTGLVPDTVVIARGDLKGIVSGRKVIIGGYAFGAHIDPIRINIGQPAFELHFLRRNETQGGVFEFDAMRSRRNFQKVV